ncbi:hypothetical protein EON62_02490 [archaeon]|nr:MAG: hypothetical protein EON62_02490 [archaeon]
MLPIIGTDPLLFDLLMKDGCVSFRMSPSIEGTLDDCLAFRTGRMADSGLLGGLADFFNLVNAIAYDVEQGVANGTLPRITRPQPALLPMWEYFSIFLDHGLLMLRDHTRMDGLDVARTFQRNDVVLTACFTVALILVFLGYFRPFITRLDQRIKHARLFVLLFPDEITRHMPSIANPSSSTVV